MLRGMLACRRVPIALATTLSLTLWSSVAAAQEIDEGRWGVNVSFAPKWGDREAIRTKLQWGNEDFPFEGSEILVGFVRDNARGGDWGVSYVRKPIKDMTIATSSTEQNCFGPNNSICETFVLETSNSSQSVVVDGVEIHWFVPFVRANRFRLGVNIGGGAGFSSGRVAYFETFTSTLTQPGFPPLVQVDTFFDETDAGGDIIGRVVPLIKVEVQAAIEAAPGLVVKFAAGLNTPAAPSLRVGAAYMFGAR
jgi:hypothetical protein